MKAITYHGRHDMRVENVPDPRIEDPGDIILRITATAICGSDLHMYNGFMMPFMKPGDIMGHEFMGVVEEVGPGVTKLKKGDRVIIPFLISCGHCFFCEREIYAGCENTNPDPGSAMMQNDIRPPAALYGYSHLYGGVPGGQAEAVRVRNADFNAFKMPEGVTDDQVLFLTDILPTGYQAIAQGNVGEMRRTIYIREDADLVQGFPKLLDGSAESSPKVADIDGDGLDDIVQVSTSGTVNVFRWDGAQSPGWPQKPSYSAIPRP